MKGFKSKRGISLIVLVITIIVMIILATAIILSISNSGIMDKANQAKVDSDLATIKEIIAVYEAECAFNDETVTLANIQTKLEESGIKTQKITKNEIVVKSISLDKTNIEMVVNQSIEINMNIEQEECTKERLYAIIQDKNYEIYENTEGNFEISSEASNLDNQGLTTSIPMTGTARLSLSMQLNKLIVTCSENVAGTATVTINYGGQTAVLEVNVKELIYFSISGVEYSAVKGMTWKEFIDSEYNNGDFIAKDNNVYHTPSNDFIRNYKVLDYSTHEYGKVSIDDVINFDSDSGPDPDAILRVLNWYF